MSRIDVYDAVTDRIVSALEEGTVPWKKPWRSVGGLPVNVKNDRPYRGINVLLLLLGGYADPRWGTFNAMKDVAVKEARNQDREIIEESNGFKKRYFEIVDGEKKPFLGGVNKSEKSTTIILWKPVKAKTNNDGDVTRDGYLYLTSYNVFNALQCEGIPPIGEEEVREFTPIEKAERIVGNYVFEVGSGNPGPPVLYGKNQAGFDVPRDEVWMPDPELFHSDQGFYSTLFHELVHSTGHESRLKRIETSTFGSDPYAREELVAEIGASFLAGVAEFDTAGGEQTAAYINGWLKAIKNDKKFVVTAAAQAQKASDLILGTKFEEVKEDGKELVAA